MRITRNLEFQIGSNEEKLPYATPDFPYIASRAELDYYREPFVPWHWHNA
ncbi:MAG TPA: AraC family transcriptional regulator, partial [Candidatus Egerieisoma faecipullorum]|nr:AraC family transcriptional regulator [Candidatus Egerieisoma faecipullorum]